LPVDLNRIARSQPNGEFNRKGKTTMKKLDEMLAEAQEKRSWGEIVIILKNGQPILLKKTIQEKVEDYPADDTRI
jgi:hypothetical protein